MDLDEARRTFEKAVGEYFAFLAAEYGFVREPMVTVGNACGITFNARGGSVLVQFEPPSGIYVTLEAATAPEGIRPDYDLGALVQESVRRGLWTRQPSHAKTFEDYVRNAAGLLRAIGHDVLTGDFRILFERQQRLVDAVRRNRPK